MTLQKATMVAGVAAMTLGMVGTFDAEANGGSGCNGGSFIAWGARDVEGFRNDFQSNCCAGSSIKVYDVCSGTQYNWIQYQHGPNSPCANP